MSLERLELTGADLPGPLLTQPVEDLLARAQDVQPEVGHLQAFAAGVARIGLPGHVAAFLEHREPPRRRLLGDREAATQFGGAVGARDWRSQAEALTDLLRHGMCPRQG